MVRFSIFMTKSGYRGMDIGEYGQPGSNGLTLDRKAGSPSTSMAIDVSFVWNGTGS